MSSLVQLAEDAGFSGSDAVIASAIAMAESGGNPSKYNPETKAPGGTPEGQGSYGLWQIYLKKHPEFAGVDLFDPSTNAQAAFDVYQKEGWHAWTTFTSGAYQKFMPALTIDAGTGAPIDSSVLPEDTESSFHAGVTALPSDNFMKYLLLGALGIAVLWLFEEVS